MISISPNLKTEKKVCTFCSTLPNLKVGKISFTFCSTSPNLKVGKICRSKIFVFLCQNFGNIITHIFSKYFINV